MSPWRGSFGNHCHGIHFLYFFPKAGLTSTSVISKAAIPFPSALGTLQNDHKRLDFCNSFNVAILCNPVGRYCHHQLGWMLLAGAAVMWALNSRIHLSHKYTDPYVRSRIAWTTTMTVVRSRSLKPLRVMGKLVKGRLLPHRWRLHACTHFNMMAAQARVF